jgi:hypothetical protein
MFANRRSAGAIFLAGVVAVAAGCASSTGSSAAATATASHSATPVAAASTAATVSASATARASASATAPASAAASSGAGSSATGVPVSRGGNLCSLLGPGDFTAAGVAGGRAPTINPDGAGGYYCVYAGTSGATGGIEFDAFTGDPVGTYQTIAGETGTLTELAATDLPGADQAGVNLNGSGGMAAIVVRSGQLIFDISFPAGPEARSRLIALSVLVLQRGAAMM